MPISIQEVARRAGISRQVVSKVLTGAGDTIRVSEATARRVRKVAEELGYLPNSAARAVSTGRFDAIGLVQLMDPHLSSSFGGLLERGIHEELTHRGMHLILGPLRDDWYVSRDYMPQILKRWCVDGLLLDISFNIPPKLIEFIERYRIPAIWLHSKQPHDCVFPDELGAFRKGTEEVLRTGHRRVAYFGPDYPNGHYSVLDRRLGYERAMREAGLEPRFFLFSKPEECRHTAQAFLESADRPTCAVCYSETDAAHLYVAALRRGIPVPDELSIVAASHMTKHLMGVQFTILQIPAAEMGREGVRMLLEKIERPEEPLKPRRLALPWVAGETLARPPSPSRKRRRASFQHS